MERGGWEVQGDGVPVTRSARSIAKEIASDFEAAERGQTDGDYESLSDSIELAITDAVTPIAEELDLEKKRNAALRGVLALAEQAVMLSGDSILISRIERAIGRSLSEVCP